MVGEQRGHVVAILEDFLGQRGEHALGPHFDEHARAERIQRFDAAHKLHRRGDLPAEKFDDFILGLWVQVAGHVGDDRQPRRAHIHAGDDSLERLAGRGDDAGMKSVRNRNFHGTKILRLKSGNRRVDGRGLATDHRLVGAVDVGQGHIAVDAGQHLFHLGEGGHHCGHAAVIGHRNLVHLAPTRADHVQRVGERERAGGDQRRVFAQAVPDDHIRRDAIAVQQPRQRHVDRQHGWLGDRGILELFFRRIDAFLIVVCGKNIAGQRLAEQRRHGCVGLDKGVGDDRIDVAQLAQHVGILRTLSGEHQGHLAGRTSPVENALPGQRLPGRIHAFFERVQCLLAALEQFVGAAKIDGQTFCCRQILRRRRLSQRQFEIGRAHV